MGRLVGLDPGRTAFTRMPSAATSFDRPRVSMSLIYTCQLNQANPFDDLTRSQRHADQVATRRQLWMPWNDRGAPA